MTMKEIPFGVATGAFEFEIKLNDISDDRLIFYS